MPPDSIVYIATFVRDREADLARMALESHGIECDLLRDDCGGMRPYISFTTGIRLVVKESDANQAKEILEELNKEAE